VAAGADEADVVDKPGEAEVHEAKEAEADEADIVDDAVMPAEADDADEAEATDDIFLPFSLTKYSAIIAEVEGYFGAQIGLGCACCFEMKDRNLIDNQPATVRLSLRI
jgi:hypothetical protein